MSVVPDQPDERTRAGPPAVPGRDPRRASPAIPARIGRYLITRRIGQGGMGVVYAARDERLDRQVALKTIAGFEGTQARERFWREARSAASVNHPHVCQIYDISDEDGELFLTMELLQGESLADRLRRGAVEPADTLHIALEMLEALGALHARGIVHRDLKPSNVFLTPHGVKLLDFGLARRGTDVTATMASGLTEAGLVVGTPGYMAPEQIRAGAVDGRTDLFAAGAILFEMLAGRPAFAGASAIDVLHATLNEQPPALTGSPAVAAFDRVIRHALVKDAGGRPASAEDMAGDLRAVHTLDSGGTTVHVHALTRLVVLPFRVLRSDPESDFLAFSLPDAIAMSMSDIDSLVIRSTAKVAPLAGDAPDLKIVAAEADVDRVVLGTLLRAGDQLRVTVQLVEAPGGTLIATHSVQSSFGDLFQLQDDLARRVVAALSLPLSTGTPTPRPRPPGDARAYGLYLRANELARTYEGLPQAREVYQQCVDIDPAFASAWAHLGRCHRVIGKYIDGSGDPEAAARYALDRALEIDPRLSIAHKFAAQLEADTGQATHAMVRLLGQATRHGNDPELFAGLIHACRYCGLFDEALAAHAEARRLDPHVATSLDQTLLMMGELDRLLGVGLPPVVAGGDDGIRVIALGLFGDRQAARRALTAMRERPRLPAFQAWTQYLGAWLDRRAEDMQSATTLGPLRIEQDPEAMFQRGWLLCDAGDGERGFDFLRRAVDNGYFVATTLERSPHFDGLRHRPEFARVLEDARAGRARALDAFREARGMRLLGVGALAGEMG